MVRGSAVIVTSDVQDLTTNDHKALDRFINHYMEGIERLKALGGIPDQYKSMILPLLIERRAELQVKLESVMVATIGSGL